MSEPTIGELVAALRVEVRALRELADERDRRYTERAEGDLRALQAALTSVKEQTSSSFAASKEAIVKAETNQTVYNATHNDLTRKMDAQYKEMIPRTEAEGRFKTMEEKIADLRESRSGGSGRDEARDQAAAIARSAQETARNAMRWAIGIAITVLLFVAGSLVLPLLKR